MKVLHLSRLISATRLSVDEHPEKAEESFLHSWRLSLVSSCHGFLVFLWSLFDFISHFNQTITAQVTGVASNKKVTTAFSFRQPKRWWRHRSKQLFRRSSAFIFLFCVTDVTLSRQPSLQITMTDNCIAASEWQRSEHFYSIEKNPQNRMEVRRQQRKLSYDRSRRGSSQPVTKETFSTGPKKTFQFQRRFLAISVGYHLTFLL